MILGAILAGGESRRFGSDKAMALLDGRPMIDHVHDSLAPWVDRVVRCGGGSPSLSDRPASGLGPLGGLAAALSFGDAHDFDRVLSVPCDTPAIDRCLFECLIASEAPAFLAACPVIGIWPTRLCRLLDNYLRAGGGRAMRAWAAYIGAEPLALPTPVNVNRPDDLRSLSSGHG